MKCCSKCKEIKDESSFHKNKTQTDGYNNQCKCCVKNNHQKYYLDNKDKIDEHNKNYMIKYRLDNPCKIILIDIKRRCENKKFSAYKYYGGRGIKCLITLEELEFLYKRDTACLMLKPSIDRKENDGNYTIDNCRFIEQSENSKLMNIKHNKRKIVLQFDLEGNFIKEWESIALASDYYAKNKNCGQISGCINQRYKTAYGFIWKQKEI